MPNIFNISARPATHLWAPVFPGGDSGKEPAYQRRRCNRHGFDPWVREIDPLEESMATHSSILAWRILVGYSLQCCKESDITEATQYTHMQY